MLPETAAAPGAQDAQHADVADPAPAHHFSSWSIQKHAERMGMWLFLATEILLFAGLFVIYTAYRNFYPATFHAASKHLDVVMGTVNTVVLITSSMTVAASTYFAKINKSRVAAWLLFASVAFGVVFLVIKGFEYSHKFHEGALPGKYYALKDLVMPGAAMFFTLYFFVTGLHAIHVVIGMAVLTWIGIRAMKGEFNSKHYIPVELGGLYWHLVDLVWIFLYPLLYLI